MDILKIKWNDKERLQEYNELAKNVGCVFNTIDWLALFNESIEIYGIYDKGGNLIGGFSLYKEKKLCFKIYRNPPFTPYIGPFLRMGAKNPVSILDAWKKVITTIADFIDNLSYSIVSISLNKDVRDTQPFIWNKFKVNPRYTYILTLQKNIDNLFEEMSAERRNDIRKAIRDNISVEKVKDFEIVKLLVTKTFHRQNKKINEYFLNKILFQFAKEENSYAFVSFKNNIPISTVFCIYDKKTAYYLLGGYDYENKHHGAGALAVWESIKYAKSLGLKYFDFEGSMVPDIEKFFRGFGGQLTPYFRISKASLPLEILLKFYKRGLF